MLNKQRWLGRYRSGALVTHSLVWDDVSVREYDSAAIAVGTHTRRAEHEGNRVDGQFRITHVFVRDGERRALAGIRLSPIGGPPPFTARERQA